MSNSRKYEYRALPIELVLGVCIDSDLIDRPDAYLSDDARTRVVLRVIAGGFRWVRSEGDYAVFEREWSPTPIMSPAEIAHELELKTLRIQSLDSKTILVDDASQIEAARKSLGDASARVIVMGNAGSAKVGPTPDLKTLHARGDALLKERGAGAITLPQLIEMSAIVEEAYHLGREHVE